MKVVTGWVLALLAVVAVGAGVEGALGGATTSRTGTVEGVLRVTHLSCPLPPGWAGGCSVRFDRYIRDNVVVIPCTGSEGDGGQACTLPMWSDQPQLTVQVSAGGRFTAALAPGKYEMFGFPCGEAAVLVTPGGTVTTALGCVWGAIGHVGPGQRGTSTVRAS